MDLLAPRPPCALIYSEDISDQRVYRPSGLDKVEDVESYAMGGFHPVHLGDLFNNRYKTIDKLDCGGFSTVWLAYDKLKHRYVAMKIIRASGSSNCSELAIPLKLNDIPTDHPGRAHMTSLLDNFTIQGPNGTHVCLVFEVAGPSVSFLNDRPRKVVGSQRLRADLAQKVAKQTMEALQFIHSHGLCHGDITTSNLLFKFASINDWTVDEVYRRLGEPRKDPILTINGSQPGDSAYLVESLSLIDPTYLSENILLPPKKRGYRYTILILRTRSYFDSKMTKYSEIWAPGCVIFELRAGQQLLASWSGGQDEILRQVVQTLGKLPGPCWAAWKKRAEFFDEDGKPKKEWSDDIPKAVEYPLAEIIGDIGSEDEEDEVPRKAEAMLEPNFKTVPEDEAAQLEDLLGSIFKWVPEERASLSEILEHPWFAMKL